MREADFGLREADLVVGEAGFGLRKADLADDEADLVVGEADFMWARLAVLSADWFAVTLRRALNCL